MTKEEYEAFEGQCRIDRFWNGLRHRRERNQLHDSTYLRYDFSDDDGGNKKLPMYARGMLTIGRRCRKKTSGFFCTARSEVEKVSLLRASAMR